MSKRYYDRRFKLTKKRTERYIEFALIIACGGLVVLSTMNKSTDALESNLEPLRAQLFALNVQAGELEIKAAELNRVEEIVPDGKGAGTSDKKLTIADLTDAERKIIFKESSFRTTAKNPKSSAFGLGQLLHMNRVKYAEAAGFHPETTDEHEQIVMFRKYVKDRYGNANEAWKFWQVKGWY